MASRNIWVSSDLHLSHRNIIKYCNRPFTDENEMNEAIIERHNAVVRPEDIWYNLGDVYFADGWKHLPRLIGRKRLILGNHDHAKCKYLVGAFQKIHAWRMFPEFGLLLTHFPVHPETLNVNKCPVNVHGHIHDRVVMASSLVRGSLRLSQLPDSRYRNVAVEQTNYAPVNIEELRVW